MKLSTILPFVSIALTSWASTNAIAGCDEPAGNILAKHLQAAVENLDCSLLKRPGLTERNHKLAGICYQFFGQISRITVDVHLSCHASSEHVISKLFGTENALGLTENVDIEAEIGEDCHLYDVRSEPLTALGKALADSFQTGGQARKALEQGLAEACKP